MNHKSSSSSSSATPSQQLPARSSSTSSNAHSTPTPAIIPLDYNYQTMSPSSLSQLRPYSNSIANHSTSHATYRSRIVGSARSQVSPDVDIELDNQYSSLFGDPVPPPPPPDFLTTQFEAAQLFRPASLELSSGEDEGFGRTIILNADRPVHTRLFSNVPFNSTFTARRLSDATSPRTFDVVPHLRPPDIQILPNSSGGSSSEPQESPNYALLTPHDIRMRPSGYDGSDYVEADVAETLETLTISDATGLREYSEATRRVSNFSEDFKSNVGAISNTPLDDSPTPPPAHTLGRQFSTESYSSNEWFRPASHDYPEFSKIPRLRPSSKNVMSIKRNEMPMQQSPVAAMINDSNGSSSGEERLLNTTQTLEQPTVSLDALTPPERPPDPSPSRLLELENELLLSPPSQYTMQRRKSSLDALGPNFLTPPPPVAPPPLTTHRIREETEASDDSKSIKRDMSPVIIRDSITTGGDYRVDQTRLHKKTSFTIISEKSPQSSRPQSPSTYSAQLQSPSRISIPAGSAVQPTAKPRYHLQRKSRSSIQLRLPQLAPSYRTPSDDSPRPSVQFNMTGRLSPMKMPQRGILHQRESLTSSQDTATPTPTPTLLRRHSTLPLPADTMDEKKQKNSETLPLITDPYRTAIPRLHRSAFDVRRESTVLPPGPLPRPLKPNPNPTRKQKGLLRILNGADTSHIPLRSNWASMDDLTLEKRQRPFVTTKFSGLEKRRRSSSTSPERRSSTQTASDRRSSNLSTITTSDFSYRRASITPQTQRRKSVAPSRSPTAKRRQSLTAPNSLPLVSGRTSRTKIAKPTTLSPIIGTPNKDSSAPQSPVRAAIGSETLSDLILRRDSLSKIPVRNDSRSNSRMSSHPGSRSTSPLKELAAQLPLSGLTSRATSSRPPSRLDSQLVSRDNSRGPSRSVSRASTRPISRAANSRPNSRMEQAKEIANSRSNSRLSTNSLATPRAGSISPNIARRSGVSPVEIRRRKSISLSPKQNRRSLTRRQSLSPPSKGRGGVRGRGKKPSEPSEQRRNSRSRIPLRSNSSSRAVRSPSRAKSSAEKRSKSRSPGKAKTPTSTRKQSPLTKSGSERKPTASAKKVPTSVRKPESSVKRTPSSVEKKATTLKKQPSDLRKTGSSNLKREPSNLQKKPSGKVGTSTTSIKREASSLSIKKPGTSGSAKAATENKRQTSSKAGSGKSTKGKEEIKPDTAVKQNAISEAVNASTGIAETAKAAAATAAVAAAVATSGSGSGTGTGSSGSGSGGSGTAKRRQPPNAPLVRMASRMSLMSLKRSDSNLSKKMPPVPAVAEETQAAIESEAATPIRKINSRGQLMTPEDVAAIPAAILEKSTKTLENIQKTVIEATDEIQKTIHENLTDLKSLETDMGRTSDGAGSPTPSVATVVENKNGKGAAVGPSASRVGTADGSAKSPKPASGVKQKSPLPPTQPIEANVAVLNAEQSATNTGSVVGVGGEGGGDASVERVSARAISVLPEVDCESANLQNYEYALADKSADGAVNAAMRSDTPLEAMTAAKDRDDGESDEIKRRSPDGQGGSQAGSGNGSREFLKTQDDDDTPPPSACCRCCRCCTKFCMPCRRSRCSRCCRRKKTPAGGGDESEQPVLSATSSATTTNLEVIDETAKTKTSCWQKLNCCKRCRKKPKVAASSETMTAETRSKTETAPPVGSGSPTKQGKCGMCLSKIFCCRAVNKVDPKSGDEMEVKKCCFCIPCRRKRGARNSRVGSMASGAGSTAWQDPEQGITPTDASVVEGAPDAMPKEGCCKRFWGRMLCCRKKPIPQPSDSRRASIKAPPPPAEDTRRKLHVDLVEYNSKMRGAIPVLPLYLAWFCAICNTVFPGLGTLLSGLFCVCVGIPRFSQYDSAKARLGALIINIIVAVAQLFCVLFCFVGWGWSIWWGTIMLKCARKLSKIRKVERLEMEEERRQAEAATAAANAARMVAAQATTEPEAAKS